MTKYLKPKCPFCHPEPARVMFESELFVGLWDGFPVSPGHALVVPRRHVPTWFEASRAEQVALLEGIEKARQEILRHHKPDGFNIGVNVQAAGGQTVFHLHIHLIPRYAGDHPDPRGGVRNVIPHKGNYLRSPQPGHKFLGASPHEAPLICGDTDPLLPHLRAHLDRAVAADICVAFTQSSGVSLVQEHLRDLLARGGQVRFLTGDYLDITDPEALLELLDLGAGVQLRVFEARSLSFHPKSYIFRFADGAATALVGSSNLSRAALMTGIEWNYRVLTSGDPQGLAEVQKAFDSVFVHPSTRPVTDEWVREYIQRRRLMVRSEAADIPVEPPEKPPLPHAIQEEALAALEATRQTGNTAGLVVLATGLGKTWLSAFDSHRPEFARVLFVAHREEILGQALKTFRRIRPQASLGLYTGADKLPDADVLFASIQTLGKQKHLRQFARDRFDYIVVDEFHHAAAATYRNLIVHFTPKFLLGLTATPERMDGGDLLGLCQENLVYRCDVFRGITDDLLVPFHYYGVPDDVDYRNIPWRSTRFDPDELTAAWATQTRALNALEHYRGRAGGRTLAFCCSQRHADFMADFFCDKGLRAVAVHAGENSAPRAASLEGLEAGRLDVVFSVDMFNEGVDLPQVDTVMMLRPTESSVIWMQQFGRGLRKADGKKHLTVIDYIGNHRTFLNKPRTLLNLPAGDEHIERALNLLLEREFPLPPGCEVTYDLKVIDILRSLIARPSTPDALRAYYRDFKERHGQRPTARELFHEGYSPASVRSSHGSWLGFVKAQGDLTSDQKKALESAGNFLKVLETTPMVKSYKMLTLLAMIDEGAFPGSLSVEALAGGFARIASRSAILRNDVGPALNDPAALIRHMEVNPIAAWAGGRGTGDRSFFTYENRRFSTLIDLPTELHEPLRELTRELAEWRLAAYLDRSDLEAAADGSFVCKVSHSQNKPILFLPDRASHPGMPTGWVKVKAEGDQYEANFAKIAVNVLRVHGSDKNALPSLLRGWFGPTAGLPGTRFHVEFEPQGDVYILRPVNESSA